MRGVCFVRVKAALLVAALLLIAAGCASSEEAQKPPEERFGHRYEEKAPDGRRTLALAPPDATQEYFYYPVPISDLNVRHESFQTDSSRVAAEVVVEGKLPNSCAALHEAEQERSGRLIDVELQMRVPRGGGCRRMTRPYRFYLSLDGRYEKGHYTLKLNDIVHPFRLR